MNAILVIVGFLLIAGMIALKITLIKKMPKKVLAMCILSGLVMIFISGAFFYAEPGYQYMVQYPTGKQVGVMKPGYNWKFWGNVLPCKRMITVRLSEDVDKESDTASAEDNSVKVLFNDGVRARVSHATRFSMPTSPQTFVKLMRDYRTEENLIQSSLIPVAKEVVRNAARELGAQKYISGGGGILENNIYDQMQHGIILLSVKEKMVMKDEEEVNKIEMEQRTIKNRKVMITEVKRLKKEDGTPRRKIHPLIQYGIAVTQSTVERVNFEPKFKAMIEQQRDAAARANVEKQKAKEAEYGKQRIIAVGEKDKAEERAKMEKAQVTRLIEAETAKKEEQLNQEKAEIALTTAKLEADAVRARGKGDADARNLKYKADGALEQKLAAWVEAQKHWAQAIGKHKQVVPSIVFGNQSGAKGNNSGAFIDMMTAAQAKALELDMTPKK